MNVRVSDERASAILGDAGICSRHAETRDNCKDVQDPLWFGLLCRWLWPAKAWLMLMQLFGIKERSAHNYASGSCPGADLLRDILRSEHGYRALSWIMRDSPPEWWTVLQHERQLAAVARTMYGQLGEVLR